MNSFCWSGWTVQNWSTAKNVYGRFAVEVILLGKPKLSEFIRGNKLNLMVACVVESSKYMDQLKEIASEQKLKIYNACY